MTTKVEAVGLSDNDAAATKFHCDHNDGFDNIDDSDDDNDRSPF